MHKIYTERTQILVMVWDDPLSDTKFCHVGHQLFGVHVVRSRADIILFEVDTQPGQNLSCQTSYFLRSTRNLVKI